MNIKRFSLQLSVFHGRTVPEDGVIVKNQLIRSKKPTE
jgi:hypothetical protein